MSAPTGAIRHPVDPRPRVPWWLKDGLAVLLMVGVTFAPAPGEDQASQPTLVLIVLVGIAAVLLPLRRRWPIPVLAALVVLFAVGGFLGSLEPGLVLAITVAVFNVANRNDRRRGIVVAAVTIVAVLACSLPVGIGSVFEPRIVQFALAIAFAAAAGDATRSRRDYIAAITERAERAERTREIEAQRRVTEERLRIARDLHDAVAHQIAVISLNAGVASSAIDTQPEKAKEALATVRGAARRVLADVGDLMSVLRSDDEAPGAVAAPQPDLQRLDDLQRQFAQVGLDVSLRVEGDLEAVEGTTGIVAYRVIQEALANAHKHGAEHRAHVLVEVGDDTLTLVVTNPVAAAAVDTAPEAPDPLGTHLGLIGIRERVASVRGTAETGAGPGGWRVLVRLPLTKEVTP